MITESHIVQFDSVSLDGGTTLAPVDVAADGGYSSTSWAWSGADAPDSVGTAATTCADWTDGSSGGHGSVGSPDLTEATNYEGPIPLSFFTGAVFTCDQPENVYCLQR